MASPPRKIQGSNADVAEGGLNVENSFTELDAATATRMGREAALRQNGGRSAMEMLGSPVEGGLQDDPNLSGAADRW